jgi:hypothetical protein
VNITWILLARPQCPVTQKEVLPHLDYWHYRSDDYTEFFCVGCTPLVPDGDRSPMPITHVGGQTWYFSAEAFAGVVEEIERQTRWRYDSDCYPIVTNARFDPGAGNAWVDRGSMVVNLGEAVQNQAVKSASPLPKKSITACLRRTQYGSSVTAWACRSCGGR